MNNENLKDSMLRTFGARGISMNREVAKNDIRLLASRFEGISMAASLIVSSKRNLLIYAIKICISFSSKHLGIIWIWDLEFRYILLYRIWIVFMVNDKIALQIPQSQMQF